MPQVPVKETSVERVINLHVEKLPEGVYLATSEDVPGLVVQADTVAEAVAILMPAYRADHAVLQREVMAHPS